MLALLLLRDISAGLHDFSKIRESRHTATAASSVSTLGCSPSLMFSQLLNCCCPKMMTASARLRCRVRLNESVFGFVLVSFSLYCEGRELLPVTYEDGATWSGLLRNRTRCHAKKLLLLGRESLIFCQGGEMPEETVPPSTNPFCNVKGLLLN